MFSVLIRKARVYDGTGGPAFTADVAMEGERVAAMGDLSRARAELEVEAPGMVIASGFIDIHTHSDTPLLVSGEAHSHIRQGVTTNVIGNCGTSLAPVTDLAVEQMRGRLGGDEALIEWEWRSLDEYLRLLEDRGVSVNVVPLVGHGTVRRSVMGHEDRRPTPEELERMRGMVREAMEDGAFGLSTGLIYTPGSYADTDELVALAAVAGEYGGLYVTHIRGENDSLMEAAAEALEIGRRAGAPVQISHLKAMGRHMWGSSVQLLQMIDRARADGLDVTADQYPYNASATGLGAYLPGWAHAGGDEMLRERLADPCTRDRMRRDILEGTGDWTSLHRGVGWENTLITRCSDQELEGRSIADIARERGVDEFDAAFDILRDCRGRVGVVYFTIGDEDLERIMAHPAVMIGSDSGAVAAEGPLARGKPHPRSFGTFSRVLGRYVRERKTVSLREAVMKMSSMPAHRLGLLDRGILRPGMKADAVVFDPAAVADRATYSDPFQYPDGVEWVFVNGKAAVRRGEHLGTRTGQVLRRGGRRW
ncbi:MAG: D-aminoacylase [Bacillota bacterium]